jgi:hypothetical protein
MLGDSIMFFFSLFKDSNIKETVVVFFRLGSLYLVVNKNAPINSCHKDLSTSVKGGFFKFPENGTSNSRLWSYAINRDSTLLGLDL